MPKLLIFLVGLIAGSGGALSWLLSESPSPPAPPLDASGAVPLAPPPGMPRPLLEDLKLRLEELKVRFQEAQAEGARAGAETEQRLRRELESYRRNPSGPAA